MILFTEYPITGLANSIHDRTYLSRISAAAVRSLILNLSGRWFVRHHASCIMLERVEEVEELCVYVCVRFCSGEACLLLACLLALCSGIQSTIEYSQSTHAILSLSGSRNVPHLVSCRW